MAQQVNLKVKGLYTAPNDFTGVPDGALDVADNCVVSMDELLEPRRGFAQSAVLGGAASRLKAITNFGGVQVMQYGASTLAYCVIGNSTPTTYTGTYATPDATLSAVRFMQANKNLYTSTANGVYKQDLYTNNPVLAGVPQGLDMQLSISGSSGFFTTNVQSSITGTTTNASANLSVLSSLGNISVGQYISGTGITAGTTVSSVTQSAQLLILTCATTAGSTTVTSTAVSIAGIVANVLITGTGILSGTRVVSTSGSTGAYNIVLNQSAIQTVASSTYSFATDPIITMSANATASNTATALSFSSGSQVGYRGVWGITDTNSNVILSAPTQFASITNTTGGTCNVQIVTTIPKNITTANYFQLYRSAQTAGSTITPLDDEQLVYAYNPTSSDIANGFITITDITPDSLRGAYLYTGVSQQGIAQQNTPPPYCKDFCLFKGYALYANTASLSNIALTLLAVGAPSGIQSGDTLTIAGIVFTAGVTEIIASGQFQVFTTGTPAQNIANTANSLIRVINRYATNTVTYAYLTSGPADLPGQILIQAQTPGTANFSITASAHGTSYNPTLPTAGTTVTSAQNINLNGLIVSKYNQPEAAPSINLIFVGSAGKQILRVIPLRDYVIILTQEGIFRLSGLTLQNFLISPFDLTTKLLAPQTAVALSNQVWGYFDQGVCSISDTGVNVRSRPIEDTINILNGTALTAIQTVAFGVAYETDRKYILALPSTSGDTSSTQQYIFNTLTNAWTRWTRNCSFGLVDPTVNKLYLGAGLANTVSVENKSGTYTDFVDEGFAVTITGYTNYNVNLASVTGINVGDVLWVSTTVFSVITAINPATNVVTVTNLAVWPNGAAQNLPAIASTVQWKPAVAGNPVAMRQFSEGAVVFKRAGFTSATMSIYSDVDQSAAQTTITGNILGLWGNFPWGGVPWGGVNRPKSIRFLVPQDKQMCSQLSCALTIQNGYSNWAIEGLALSIMDAGKEIA